MIQIGLRYRKHIRKCFSTVCPSGTKTGCFSEKQTWATNLVTLTLTQKYNTRYQYLYIDTLITQLTGLYNKPRSLKKKPSASIPLIGKIKL